MVMPLMGLGSKVKSVLSQSLDKIDSSQMFTALAVIIASIGFWDVKEEFEKHCYIRTSSTLFKNLSVFSLIYINTKNVPLSVLFTIFYNTVRIIIACKDTSGDSDLVAKIKGILDSEKKADEVAQEEQEEDSAESFYR